MKPHLTAIRNDMPCYRAGAQPRIEEKWTHDDNSLCESIFTSARFYDEFEMKVDPIHVLQLSSQCSGVPLTNQEEVLRFARVCGDSETISDLDPTRFNLT
ncbi:hypothetical protein ALC53_06265 [Atta colombica]|uniref:Uncharacterized protein n=1 Tax=Atta colombica TaxID=520822 RepID=A0A195BFQ7_9HYME|nr:hypothetical protein ALC53_06265 [Atta colombica]